MNPAQRYQELKDKVIRIAGLNADQFGFRKPPYPSINCLIWQEMRNEGFLFREIAEACNKHHATIVVQTRKMREIISERNPSWKSIIQVWDRLQDELKDERISNEILQSEHKKILEKEHLIRRITALPKEDRMDIILAVQDSMSMTEINDKWETNTTIDQL